MSKLKAVATNENLDPDLVDFCAPTKKAKCGSCSALLTEVETVELAKRPVVSNTVKNMQWAVQAFLPWCREKPKQFAWKISWKASQLLNNVTIGCQGLH